MNDQNPSEGFLLLADGSLFRGVAHSPGTAFGEVVFNTCMTGYQEVLTDPSYRRQIVVMTLPHIGNYGVCEDMAESRRPWVEGFIARRFTQQASNHGSEENLLDYLRRHSLPTLSGIDTRALVRHLRQRGAMRGVISSEIDSLDRLTTELASSPEMAGRALVREVTCEQAYTLTPERSSTKPCHIALYDFGAKASLARQLLRRGAKVTILPADTPATECLALGVDGVLLSNGPGDPEPLDEQIAIVRALIASQLPIFAICLGHQLLGLALGGRTCKLKFGHHGGNQPVQDLATGKVTITSQNHGFMVDSNSLPATCRVTHRNLNDGTVEGLAMHDQPVFSVQYHPEAAPGPHDAEELFDQFLTAVRARIERKAAAAP